MSLASHFGAALWLGGAIAMIIVWPKDLALLKAGNVHVLERILFIALFWATFGLCLLGAGWMAG